MDISKITDYLYISSRLQTNHIDELTRRNVSLVISMIGSQRPPDIFANSPFHLLWLQTFDSILIPIPMNELIKGVQTALPAIQSGQSILVYCAKGRHRSVAMAAVILIAMGHTAYEAMELICSQRMVADPHIWHISRRIYKFEKYWQNRNHKPTSIINHIEDSYAEIATLLTSTILLSISTWANERMAKSVIAKS